MINKYRKEIDLIDQEMKQLFLKRMTINKNVAEYKKQNKLPIFDANREKEIFASLTNDINDPTLKKLYQSFLFKVVELSKIYQKEQNND